MNAAAETVRRYDDAQVALLAELVRFRTVHEPGTVNAEQPAFRALAAHLRQLALRLGFDFQDLGTALVIGSGEGDERISLAHTRRIELIVALTEESDWGPFEELLVRYPPPQVNIGFDSQYPVVVAEKVWGGLWLDFAAAPAAGAGPRLTGLDGGSFISQVPEDASVVAEGADEALLGRIRARMRDPADGLTYHVEQTAAGLRLRVTGLAAHSSTPENGRNALTHLAALLAGEVLADNAGGRTVNFVNSLLGTGLYGERFGRIAWSHPELGPLLAVYRHFTGAQTAEPVGIGGATHVRLLPNAVNFGPSMPGLPYTGHSGHEFVTRAQLTANLRMVTAALAWLATADPPVAAAGADRTPL